MISVHKVSKRYGKFLAVEEVTIEARPGELTVLLGPNGAGKSTLIKSICGLLRFTGSITINGFDNRSLEAKRRLGYVPEMPALYPLLTVHEHLEFIARAYRLEDWEQRAQGLLERFELRDKAGKLGKELSKGMQQKLSVCCALLPEPSAIVLDEPLVGLDPHGIRELKALLRDLRAQGRALLVSTHIIDSVEDDWDATYIMDKACVAALCRRDETEATRRLEDLYFSITEARAQVEEDEQ